MRADGKQSQQLEHRNSKVASAGREGTSKINRALSSLSAFHAPFFILSTPKRTHRRVRAGSEFNEPNVRKSPYSRAFQRLASISRGRKGEAREERVGLFRQRPLECRARVHVHESMRRRDRETGRGAFCALASDGPDVPRVNPRANVGGNRAGADER